MALNDKSKTPQELEEYISNHLKEIKFLKSKDITFALQPSSILNKLKKTKYLNEVLESWEKEGNLEKIISYIAKQGDAQNISNTLNALKGTYQLEIFLNNPKCKRAIDVVINNGNAQNIANTLNALKDTNQLETFLINPNFERAVNEVINNGIAQNIANTLNALKDTDQLEIFLNNSKFKEAIDEVVKRGDIQSIANTLNTLKDTKKLEIFLNNSKFKEAINKVIKDGNAQSISNTLNALKNTKQLEVFLDNSGFERTIYEVINRGSSQSIANTINVLKDTKKLEVFLNNPGFKEAIDKVVRTGDAQNISNTLNALKDTKELEVFLNNSGFKEAINKVVNNGSSQSIANTLNALKNTNKLEIFLKNPNFKEAINKVVNNGNSQSISNTLNTLKGKDSLEIFLQHQNFKEAIIKVIKKGDAQSISNTLNALKGTDKLEIFLQHPDFEEAINEVAKYGNAQEISNTLNALKNTDKLENFLQHSNFKHAISKVTQDNYTQSISNTLNALRNTDKLEIFLQHENFEEAINKVIKDGNAQNIANTLNALKNNGKLEAFFDHPEFKRAIAKIVNSDNFQSIAGTLNALKGTEGLKIFLNDNNFNKAIDEVVKRGDAQSIANTLNALKNTNKLEVFLQHPNFKETINEIIKKRDPQNIAKTLNALKGNDELKVFLQHPNFGETISEVINKGDSQNIANTLNALKGSDKLELFLQHPDFEKAITKVINNGNAQEISNALNALKDTKKLESFLNNPNFDIALNKVIESNNTQNTANTLNSLKNTHKLETFLNNSGFNKAIDEIVKRGDAQNIANTLNALKGNDKLEIFLNNSGFNETIDRVIRGSAQDITNTLNALKGTNKLEIFLNNPKFEKAINKVIVSGNYQNISNTLNAIKNSKQLEIFLNNPGFEKAIDEVVKRGDVQSISSTLNALRNSDRLEIFLNHPKFKEVLEKVIKEGNAQSISTVFNVLTSTDKLEVFLRHKNFEKAINKVITGNPQNIANTLTALRDKKKLEVLLQHRDFQEALDKVINQGNAQDIVNTLNVLIGTRVDKKDMILLLEKLNKKLPSNSNQISDKDSEKLIAYTQLTIWRLEETYGEIENTDFVQIKDKLDQIYKTLDNDKTRGDSRFNINQFILLSVLEDLNNTQDPEIIKRSEKKLEEWFIKLCNSSIHKKDSNQPNLIEYINHKFGKEPEVKTISESGYQVIKKDGAKTTTSRNDSTALLLENEVNDIIFLDIKENNLMVDQLFSLHKVDGEYYVSVIAGGNAIKGSKVDGEIADNGRLIAIKLKSLFGEPKSKIRQFLDNIGYREGFYYIQRALMPNAIGLKYKTADLQKNEDEMQIDYSSTNQAAKNKKEIESAAKVMEGRFNISHQPKGYQINNSLPFIVEDGCGYIKKSVLDKMLTVNSDDNSMQVDKSTNNLSGIKSSTNEVIVKKERLNKKPFITYAAFQEVKRTEENQGLYDNTIKETVHNAIEKLKAMEVPENNKMEVDEENNNFYKNPDYLRWRRIYTIMTTGDPDGFTRVAVPIKSKNPYAVLLSDKLEEKQAPFCGRSPYDKLNIFAPDNYSYSDLMQKTYAIQYSLTGADEKDRMSFYKGLLIAIDDDKWPEELKDRHIITCTDDRKIFSSAKNKLEIKPEPNSNTSLKGVLTPIDLFQPGKLAGVSPELQTKFAGDYDGDILVFGICDKDSNIYKLIQYYNEQFYHELNGKINKTFTPSDGSLLRIKEVMNIKMGYLLESFTYGYNKFIAFNEKTTKRFIEEFEKSDEEISDIMGEILQGNYKENDVETNIKKCLQIGIKVGTDSYKTSVAKEPFFKFINHFKKTAKSLGIPNPIYFTSLIKEMQNNEITIDELKNKVEQQKEYYSGSYAFDVTYNVISELHKQKEKEADKESTIPVIKHLSKKIKPERKYTDEEKSGVAVIMDAVKSNKAQNFAKNNQIVSKHYNDDRIILQEHNLAKRLNYHDDVELLIRGAIHIYKNFKINLNLTPYPNPSEFNDTKLEKLRDDPNFIEELKSKIVIERYKDEKLLEEEKRKNREDYSRNILRERKYNSSRKTSSTSDQMLKDYNNKDKMPKTVGAGNCLINALTGNLNEDNQFENLNSKTIRTELVTHIYSNIDNFIVHTPNETRTPIAISILDHFLNTAITTNNSTERDYFNENSNIFLTYKNAETEYDNAVTDIINHNQDIVNIIYEKILENADLQNNLASIIEDKKETINEQQEERKRRVEQVINPTNKNQILLYLLKNPTLMTHLEGEQFGEVKKYLNDKHSKLQQETRNAAIAVLKYYNQDGIWLTTDFAEIYAMMNNVNIIIHTGEFQSDGEERVSKFLYNITSNEVIHVGIKNGERGNHFERIPEEFLDEWLSKELQAKKSDIKNNSWFNTKNNNPCENNNPYYMKKDKPNNRDYPNFKEEKSQNYNSHFNIPNNIFSKDYRHNDYYNNFESSESSYSKHYQESNKSATKNSFLSHKRNFSKDLEHPRNNHQNQYHIDNQKEDGHKYNTTSKPSSNVNSRKHEKLNSKNNEKDYKNSHYRK